MGRNTGTHIRRRISGRKKVPLGDSSEYLVDENDDDSSSSQSDEDEVSERSEQSGKSEDENENASDGTEDYNQEGSSCAEAPNRWDQEKTRRQRRGGTHHSVGLASFLRDEPVQKRNISPELKRLKWIRTKPWRRDFRERVKPGVPGVDADTLFQRERNRLANVSRHSSPDGAESQKGNGKVKERFTLWRDGSPVPIWMRDCIEKHESAVATVTALEKGSHGTVKPIIGSKQRIAVPSMMVFDSVEPEGNVLCLHPLNFVGMDTCSARSVSSEASDFL